MEKKPRLTNIADDYLVLVEVQVGDYLGEDDFVRLEDKYGRHKWAIEMDKSDNDFIFESKRYQEIQNIELQVFHESNDFHSLEVKYSQDENFFNVGKNATFGAVKMTGINDFNRQNALLDSLTSFIGKRFGGYEIKLPPSYLDPITHLAFEYYFKKNGAKIKNETNQYIDLSAPLEERSFSATNRKIVRRLKREGCEVRFEDRITKEGYKLLERNRARRGVRLSLSFNELKKQSEVLRKHYLFASCFNAEGELIAYGVCVRLRRDLLYVLYWGEECDKRSKSPVVLLCHELVEYSLRNGLRYLDAGISSLNGELDTNLFDFKQRLGFKFCNKLIVSG